MERKHQARFAGVMTYESLLLAGDKPQGRQGVSKPTECCGVSKRPFFVSQVRSYTPWMFAKVATFVRQHFVGARGSVSHMPSVRLSAFLP